MRAKCSQRWRRASSCSEPVTLSACSVVAMCCPPGRRRRWSRWTNRTPAQLVHFGQVRVRPESFDDRSPTARRRTGAERQRGRNTVPQRQGALRLWARVTLLPPGRGVTGELCAQVGGLVRFGDLRGADRRRRERRGDDDHHEGEGLDGDAEAVARERVAEDED